MLTVLMGAALAQTPTEPPPVAPEPRAEIRQIEPLSDRLVERDRRSRSAYRVAGVLALVGFTTEIVGVVTEAEGLAALGGTAEAIAAPAMAITALRSANTLRKSGDMAFPTFGYVAVGATSLDLLFGWGTLREEFDQSQKRTAAVLAITSRAVTFTSAVLQQRANNRMRRRLGLRVGRRPGSAPRRTVAFSPWLGPEAGGILLTLSERRAGPAEQP